MEYVSTRGQVAPLGFVEAVLMGMADDGGLLVPVSIPKISADRIADWQGLSYADLAFAILSRFVEDEIPGPDLKRLIAASYAGFRDPAVAPLRRLDDDRYVLELFHGPTFAFKDLALQLLGNVYEYLAVRSGVAINILGATSGDTGASAIAGVRGKAQVRICVLYPDQRVSRVQELQMTTVTDNNVLNLAVQGTFDDCQRIIKEIFSDLPFKRQHHLRAVNSINILRILAQSVYYFYAYYRLVEAGHHGRFDVSVPTGNFGNILAGYLAARMGVPIGRLILATNENNILERFVNHGVYQPGEFRQTHSPSMDIQVASNFERYLYYLFAEDPEPVRKAMADFRDHGRIAVDGPVLDRVQSDFAAASVSNVECLDTIAGYREHYGYVIDPHTACAAAAVDRLGTDGVPCVILSTAHPAKFGEALEMRSIEAIYPAEISQLLGKPSKRTVVAGSTSAVKNRLTEFLT